MALSAEQIRSLLASKDGKQSKRGFYCVGRAGGESEVIQGIAPAEQYGRFHGRAGSIRRTSKGATVRNLDGSARYIAGNITEESILYYVIRR